MFPLAFVVVYNLLASDLQNDKELEEIERVINLSIDSRLAGEKATEKNMIFSFPQDPSVTTPEIPVVVNVVFYSRGTVHKNIIAEAIKREMLKALSQRGEVRNKILVDVQQRDPSDGVAFTDDSSLF